MLDKRLIRYIQAHNLFDRSHRILVAISGGPDSVALAHLLHKAGYQIALAHFNFLLRGKDSLEDEQFVRQFAKQLGVKLFVARANTRAFAQKHKLSLEMAARTLRYKWFFYLAEKHGFDRIATAHTADDNAETFLLNLARGTGLKGLSGIPIRNGKIVRPVLFAYKQELIDYCKQQGLSFRIDRTNQQSDFSRNKIRNIIIPVFQEINPAFVRNVSRTIENVRQAWAIVDDWAKAHLKRILRKQGDRLILLLPQLLKSKHARFLLFYLLNALGFNPDQIDQLYRAIHHSQPGKLFYAPGYVVLLDRQRLIIQKRHEPRAEEIRIERGVSFVKAPGFALQFRVLPKTSDLNLKQPPQIAVMDLDKVKFPLTLRTVRTGDRFVPFGMKGSRKLSDFLKDLRINRLDKSQTWVLLDAEGKIIWVVGIRIDDRVKITRQTKRILQITKTKP